MSKLLKWMKKVITLLAFAGLAGILVLGLYIAVLAISRSAPLVLPAPTGSYTVGRMELDWTDSTHTDPLASQPGLKRELAVWVWYPAKTDPAQKPAPYLPPAWSAARNKDQGIGILIENDLARIQTHSFENLAVSSTQSTYPVLIMQPGMGPSVPDYTILAENLASHGYIVVGLNPTYTSNLVAFPNGRIAFRADLGTIPDSATLAETDQIASRIMAIWAQDVIFAMNQLQRINAAPADPFYQHLDLAHIGVFGHSFGGATAIAVCQQDARCKAGADLDGTPFGAEKKATIPTPFLFMTGDYSQGCDENCAALRQIANQVKPGPVYVLSVKGAAHFNFTDLPVRQVPAVRPLFNAAHYTGSIDPLRGEQITNAYLLAFFDRSLKNIDSKLLDGPSALYPEVQFP